MTLEAIGRLHRATHAIAVLISRIPGTHVNQAEAHVLVHLHAGGPSRINDIHAAFGHRRSTLTSLLDRLEKRKLLKRSADPDDRRSVRVSLTAGGQRLAARLAGQLSSAETQVLKRFSMREIESFQRVADAFAAVPRRRAR